MCRKSAFGLAMADERVQHTSTQRNKAFLSALHLAAVRTPACVMEGTMHCATTIVNEDGRDRCAAYVARKAATATAMPTAMIFAARTFDDSARPLRFAAPLPWSIPFYNCGRQWSRHCSSLSPTT